MKARHRRSLRAILAHLAVLAAVLATSLLVSPPALAQDYARQSSASYSLVDSNHNPHPTCRGRVWIGQTTANYIEAYSSVTCASNTRPNINRTYVGIYSGSPFPLASRDHGCFECPVITASTSVQGGAPGTRYCATGLGTLGPQKIEGSGTACFVI